MIESAPGYESLTSETIKLDADIAVYHTDA